MKHKNDEVIRAWLDGKTVQYRYAGEDECWVSFAHFAHGVTRNPDFLDENSLGEWRIKPEPNNLWVVYDNHGNIAHLTKFESEAQNFAKYYGVMYTVVEMKEVVK